MGWLRITPDLLRQGYLPGETVRGTVTWSFDRSPDAIELRLFWYTSGKGTKDIHIEESIRFENPGESSTREFTFKLPDGPYSFSGKLISLNWAIEAVLQPIQEAEKLNIILSPTEKEIVIYDGETESFSQ